MDFKKICILGGTGFVGRHLASELARRGYRMRVLTRRRFRHRDLLIFPTLELIEADIHDPGDLAARLEGCDAVVNLVGILNESGPPGADFRRVHVELPGKVAGACKQNGIARLLHMSALNASPEAPSAYLKSKAEGENAVHEASDGRLAVTSFRPSIIFGRDDAFFNRFATLLRVSPFVFPLACPQARLAPVAVDNVVDAFVRALTDKSTFGKRYELCGPRQYTLRELVQYTAQLIGVRRRVLGLNAGLSRLQARVLERLPGKPFSVDNYLSLQVDSVCAENGLEALGITPISIEGTVPLYLGRHGRNLLYERLRSRHEGQA